MKSYSRSGSLNTKKDLLNKPAPELESGLNQAQDSVVALRDHCIDGLRVDNNNSRLHDILGSINTALSLIIGLEYPVSGFQRNKIKQAEDLLRNLRDMRVDT